MKRIFVTAAALLMLVGCKETVTESPELADNVNAVTSGSVRADDLGGIVHDEYTEHYGMWTGFTIDADTAAVSMVQENIPLDSETEYGADKISINLKSLAEGKAEAQGIIYGQKLLLHGNYKDEGDGLRINLFRGGKTDRIHIFELVFEKEVMVGTYTANRTEMPKKVELKHNSFKYDPEVMLKGSGELVDWSTPKEDETPKPKAKSASKKKIVKYKRPQYRFTSEEIETINSSTTKLTEAQLKNYTKFDLEILRNTIYARHGYAFKKEFLRGLFNYADWYVAVSDNVDNELTDIEKQNIALLTRMEQYAQDHYSYFGR